MLLFQKWALHIVILLLTISCKQTTTLSSVEKEQIKSEVNKMLLAYHEAIEKDGLTAEFNYLDNSSAFFWIPPGYQQALKYDSVRNIL